MPNEGLAELIESVEAVSPLTADQIADAAGTLTGHDDIITEDQAHLIELASRLAINYEEVRAFDLTTEASAALAVARNVADLGGELPRIDQHIIDLLVSLGLWPDSLTTESARTGPRLAEAYQGAA